MNTATRWMLGLLPLMALACGSEATPQPQVPEPEAAPSAPAAAPASTAAVRDDGSKSNISISERIRKACGINDTEAFFAFNSASVRPADRKVFKALATCFSTGPLKDERMQLVGHTDNVGEEEYNMSLGGRRAESVKKVIIEEGLAASKAESTSRGEMDAKGTDEASQAQDRRVEILIAE